MSAQTEVFIRRQGRGRWVKEWSIGSGQYHQNARFVIYDAPDRADFNLTFIEPSFSLLYDLSPHPVNGRVRLRNQVGLMASLGVVRARSRWTGYSDGVGVVDYTRRYWTWGTLYAGPALATSLRVGAGISLESLLAYRFTYLGYDPDFARLHIQRLSWTLGIGAAL